MADNALLKLLHRMRREFEEPTPGGPHITEDLDEAIGMVEKGTLLSEGGCGANATTLDDRSLRINKTILGPCLVIPLPGPEVTARHREMVDAVFGATGRVFDEDSLNRAARALAEYEKHHPL